MSDNYQIVQDIVEAAIAKWPNGPITHDAELERQIVAALAAAYARGQADMRERLKDVLTKYDLAVQEAEAILGSEYADHYGPFYNMVHAARRALPDAEPAPARETGRG